MKPNEQFAQYTIRCSKELPACASCQQLATDCVYSRAGIIHRRRKRKLSSTSDPARRHAESLSTNSTAGAALVSNSDGNHTDELDRRLRSIEQSILSLTRTVATLAARIPAQADNEEDIGAETNPHVGVSHFNQAVNNHTRISNQQSVLQSLGNPTNNNLASASQLAVDINALSGLLRHVKGVDTGASHGLNPLSSICEKFWNNEEFVKFAQPQLERHGSFFALSEHPELAQSFSKVICKANNIFPRPSDDIIQNLLYEPWNVEPKGWLILFNGILLTSMPVNTPTTDILANKLRWNVWSAINDARVSLEPTTLNIYALLLLACHVQDFVTPSLSWMLVNNSCRMFQSIYQAPAAVNDQPLREEDLLFWSLNCMDKSMALIFGRAPTLVGGSYESVFVPEISKLQFYHPHVAPDATSNAVDLLTEESERVYGGHYLRQMFLLSRIMTMIWKHLYTEDRQNMTQDVIQRMLDGWRTKTLKVLSEAIDSERRISTTTQIDAMELGLFNMRFQYHYLTVLMNRNDRSQVCLNAAREALRVIENLVSDANDVYNGIVWQLLYCPFTPLLVLVQYVLSATTDHEVDSDVEIIAKTVGFYQAMSVKHSQAKALEDTARSLLDLVRDSMRQRRHQHENVQALLENDTTRPRKSPRTRSRRSHSSQHTGHELAQHQAASQIDRNNDNSLPFGSWPTVSPWSPIPMNRQGAKPLAEQIGLQPAETPINTSNTNHDDASRFLEQFMPLGANNTSTDAAPITNPVIFDWFAWEHWQNHLSSF